MPIIREIIYGAAARGASISSLCDGIGIIPADLNDSEKQLDYKEACKAWELAVNLTGDEQLGLHLGQSATPFILGLVGHLMQSSPTLLEAFRNVSKHSEVATNMFHYYIRESKDQIILQFKPASLWLSWSPETARHATEQAMSGTLQVFRLLSGKRTVPLAAASAFGSMGDRKEYDTVFASPVAFKAKVSQLVFQRAQLQVAVLSYDQSLYPVFDQLLRERKSKQKPGTVAYQIKQAVFSEFKGQVPGIDVLAAYLHLTVRSLQRRLAGEGTSFRQFSAQLKKELASQFLLRSDSKVSEIATLLGYSEASAFRRAYKSWTRKTPRQQKR